MSIKSTIQDVGSLFGVILEVIATILVGALKLGLTVYVIVKAAKLAWGG